MTFDQLPKKSITYLIICGCGVVGYIFLAIYPYHRALKSMDVEILKITAQIEEQKILSPAFKELLQKSRIKEPAGLPFPEKKKLSKDDTDKILTELQGLARDSRLTIERIAPDVQSLSDNAEHLMTDIVLKGDFLDLRNFFIQLGGLPYFEHIEKFNIRSVEGTKEINLRIWIAHG